jgi:hypothetical protein
LSASLASLDRQMLDMRASLYTLKRRKYASHLALQYDALALLGNQCSSISRSGKELVELIPQAPIYANETAPMYDGSDASSQVVTDAVLSIEAVSIDSFRIPSNGAHSRDSSATAPISPSTSVGNGDFEVRMSSPPFLPSSLLISERKYEDDDSSFVDNDNPLYASGYGEYSLNVTPKNQDRFRGYYQ